MTRKKSEKAKDKASESSESMEAEEETPSTENRVQQLLTAAKELSQELQDNDLELAKAALSKAQASLGDCDSALALAEEVLPGNARWQAFTIVGKSLGRYKPVEDAIEIALSQEDEEDRACLLDGIARAQAEQNHVRDAIDVANKIENEHSAIGSPQVPLAFYKT